MDWSVSKKPLIKTNDSFRGDSILTFQLTSKAVDLGHTSNKQF